MSLRSPSPVAALLLLAPLLHAQTPPASQTPFTLHTNTRLVLTDVTVTDRNGNPVLNLPRSAFHITDGGTPQQIASFEEHTSAEIHPPAPTPAEPNATYSNDFVLHAPPVLDVILLDITNLALEDQMYLSFQLNKFLDALPAGQQLAIYERTGDITILLQNFTADRKLLLSAVHHAIPRFPPTGREYLQDLDTLQQIGTYLSDLPGRKNVLWFSGGSTLYLLPDVIPDEDQAAIRRIYDSLEASRIAIYPIDARGLDTDIGTKMQVMTLQHMRMESSAEATGGHAFFNTNGLQQAAARVLAGGADFYTLTYSPSNYREDKKWHKVRVSLDLPGYTLSYRHGYFADGINGTAPAEPHTLRQLLAGGNTESSAPVARAPIIFQAQVLPASQAAAHPSPVSTGLPADRHIHGGIPYSIHYDIPAESLSLVSSNGRSTFKLILAAFAINQYGTPIDHRVEQFTLSVDMAKFHDHPHAEIPLDQHLQFTKGNISILLAVVDVTSGRSGNVQVALDVPGAKSDK